MQEPKSLLLEECTCLVTDWIYGLEEFTEIIQIFSLHLISRWPMIHCEVFTELYEWSVILPKTRQKDQYSMLDFELINDASTAYKTS